MIFMQKRTRVAVLAALGAMFCVGALGYWVVGFIERQSMLFQLDTLQKLTYCAQINSNQAEGYSRTLLTVQSLDPAKAIQYRAEAKSYEEKNNAALEHYRDSISEDQRDSLRLLDELMGMRERYHQARDHVFSLVEHGQRDEALRYADSTMWPAYHAYTDQGDKLFTHDVTVGKQRAEDMRRIALRFKFVSATLCILLFLFGLAAPFLFLFGIVNWIDNSVAADRA